MGSRKGELNSADESEEDRADMQFDEDIAKPAKKLKKSKEVADGGGKTSTNPMENRKNRKEKAKQKHQGGSDSVKVPKAEQLRKAVDADMSEAPVASSSGNVSDGVPEFHVENVNNLAVAERSSREAAVEKMVRELKVIQAAYEKLGSNRADEGSLQSEAEKDKDDGLDNNWAPSLKYAIERLINGVCSSRECARQGFALGLTILVRTITNIKVDSMMKLITSKIEIKSSMKGQDAREHLLGRLFAYGALVRSGRIAKEWFSDKDTPLVKEFISCVLSIATKKQYLREPAVLLVLDLAEKMPVEALLSQVLQAPGMLEWFQKASEVGNPDALFLALKLREKISMDNEIFNQLLPYPFTPNKLFTIDHLTSLIPCFKESTFCQPRVHGIWPLLTNILLSELATQEDASRDLSSSKKHKRNRKSNSSTEEIVKNLNCFFEIVVEGTLLLSSHDRKHLAFEVVLLILPRLPASCVHIVLSHRLIQCLMDILSTKDSWLYKAAQHLLKEIVNWAGKDDDKRIAVIVALQKHSNGRFDCITRTKTVKDLMSEFRTEAGCLLFVQNLVNMFVDEGDAADEPSDQSQTTDDNSDLGSIADKNSASAGSPDYLRSWVIDSLPRVLKDLKLEPGSKLVVQKEIMKFLAVQGLFSACLGTEVTSFELQEKFKWPKAATSNELCQMCIEQLQRLLASAQKDEGSPTLSNGLEPNDLGSFFMRFLDTLRNIPSVSLSRPLSNEDEKAMKKLQATETWLYREERNMGPGTIANKLHSLRYLLIQLLLQVLLRPGEFYEAAFELVICCKKAFPSDILDDSDEDDGLDEDGAPELMNVLVDTLLALLPEASPPVRSSIEQVFKFFCNDITHYGLLRMLKVVKEYLKPPRHQAMGSEEDDDDDDEEVLDIDETGEMDELENIKDVDNDGGADDSDAVGFDVDDIELPEGSDDSDGGLDDDAMFRMDSYLARIFKERKNQAGGETANSQLVLFKLRVLTLLETYIHENPGKPEALTVYAHLAQAFVNLHTGEGNEQLGQRIWGILQKKIFKAKEYPKGGDIQFSTLESLLRKSLRLASKPIKKKNTPNTSKKKQLASLARQKMLASLGQQSGHWILKIIHASDLTELELQAVSDIFKLVLADYFNSKKSRLKPGFLKEAFQRQPWLGHRLFPVLLDKCKSAKFEFRCINSLDLVDGVLKSLIPRKSNGDVDKDASMEPLKVHMSSLAGLVSKLVTNMPNKQAWRAQVRKFCGQTFKVISKVNLVKDFLEGLSQEAQEACESQLGDLFLNLKRESPSQ